MTSSFHRLALALALCVGAALPFLLSQTREERLKQIEDANRWNIIRPVVRGQRAAVAAGTPMVTEASMRTLYAGGNAVDAGVAALFAGGVSEFSHFGFGGEAPILIRTPEGKVVSIAGIGTAPQLMTREVFLSREVPPEETAEMERRGRTDGPIPAYGILPAVVPGMVDAGLLALRDYGTKSFGEVIQPAIDLADGFPIDNQRAGSIAAAALFLPRFPTSLAVFAPDGSMPRPGEVFRQPDLSAYLAVDGCCGAARLSGGQEPSAGDRRRARLLLPRRDCADDRRLCPRERRAAALRRHGELPA